MGARRVVQMGASIGDTGAPGGRKFFHMPTTHADVINADLLGFLKA